MLTAVAVSLAMLVVAACGSGTAEKSPSSTGAASPTRAWRVTSGTEMGAIQLKGGVLKIGTGAGTLNMRVGQNMVPFDRAFVETGTVGVKDNAEPKSRISFSPLSSLKPGMNAADFAALLASQSKRHATAVDGLANLGRIQAVAADTTTAEGLPSRVHLLTVGDKVWNLTLSAPTRDRLDSLVAIAGTLSLVSKVSSLGREVSVSLGNDGASTAPRPGSEGTQSVVSANGALRGILNGQSFSLTMPGGTLSLSSPGGLSLATDSTDANFIGLGRVGVAGCSVLFGQASSGDFTSSERLAEDVAARVPDKAEAPRPLPEVTSVAGHSAVAAEAKTQDGGAVRYYVVDVGGGNYLAIVVRSPNVETYPIESLASMLDGAQIANG